MIGASSDESPSIPGLTEAELGRLATDYALTSSMKDVSAGELCPIC